MRRPWYSRLFRYLIPIRGDRAREVLRKIVFLIALIVLILSSVYIANYIIHHLKTDMASKQLAGVYEKNPAEEKIYDLPEGYLQKFGSLYEINNQIKGWVSVPNTKINHPVVQSKDNDFYLYRGFDKEYDPHGIPYADFRSKIEKNITSKNIVMYAHNINGGKLFGDFNKYRKSEFYRENPILTFDSVYEESEYKIYGVFITDTNTSDPDFFDYHNYIDFPNEKSFNSYINQIDKRRLYDTGVDINYSDNLLTFSTCANELKDGRLVVVARKLRKGESNSIDESLVTSNNKVLYPQAWYNKFGGSKPTY